MTTTSIQADQTLDYKLENGLQVFLIQDATAPLVSVRTYVRAGSINEDPFLGTGISHYLEHVVAGGSTTKRVEADYKSQISKLGGAFNAYTTNDHTSYYINTVPEDLNAAISMLYEWMFYCSFDKREVSREKEVIVREIEKNSASVGRQFHSLAQHNFYKYHPSRLPVIGYLDKFKTLEREDLVNYYKAHYTPSNMILVIGGNFSIPEIKKSLETTFGTVPRMSHPPTTTLFPEPRPFAQRFVEVTGNTSTTLLSIRFSTVDLFSDDLYGLDLIDFILGNGDDSILYKKLVEEKKLAYSIGTSSHTPAMTTGYFEITAEIDYENKDKVIQHVLNELNKLKKKPLQSSLLARAKKQKLAEDIFSIDTIEDKVTRLGQAYLYGHSKYFFETYISSFKNISSSDLLRISSRYFDPTHMVVTVLKPTETTPTAPVVVDESKPKAQEPTLKILSNGVRVIFFHDDSLPRVFSRILAFGGIRAETVTTNGIGNLIAENLGKESPLYTRKSLQSAIEDNGATLFGTIGNNTIYLTLTALTEDFMTLLPMQIDSFLHPIFAKSEIDEERRQLLKSIEKRQDDWFTYGRYHFRKEFYGNHHYGLSMVGEKESLSKITIPQMEAHHNSFLVPDQMIVTVFGKFDEKETLAVLEKTVGTLKAPEKPFKAMLMANPEPHTKPLIVRKPITQDVGAVFIGYDGVSVTETATQLKLDLLDAVLSGMSYPGGRLHNSLREEGLVYMVHGSGFTGLEKGHILYYALTNTEKVDVVTKMILQHTEDLKAKEISDLEFEQAIAQVNYYYKERHSSLDSLSIITATDELYKLGFKHYLSFEEKIKTLKKSDVQDMAKLFLVNPQSIIFEK